MMKYLYINNSIISRELHNNFSSPKLILFFTLALYGDLNFFLQNRESNMTNNVLFIGIILYGNVYIICNWLTNYMNIEIK